VRSAAAAAVLSAVPAILGSGTASALFAANPFVAGEVTHQTNVFSVSRELLAELRPGDPRRADTIFRYSAGTDAIYSVGLQKIYGAIEGRRYQYREFNELDHDAYLWSAGGAWNVANVFDGGVEVRQERRMASFINRRSTELTLELERQALAMLNFNLTPHWRIETGARVYDLASPLPDFPDFALREVGGNAGIEYVTDAKLSFGVNGEFTEGEFRGIPNVPGFDRRTGELTLGYALSDLTELSAAVGYTNLKGEQIEVDGVTADLTFERQLTALTELRATAFRRIGGYLAGANAITDTGTTIGIAWQPTFKIRLEGEYTYIHSRYTALSEFSTIPSGRRDNFHLGKLSIGYQMLDWLALRLFGSYRDHRSTFTEPDESFNDATIGGEIRLHWPRRGEADERTTRPQT
jgi:hypothetical protein